MTFSKGSDLSRQQGKVLHVTGTDSGHVEPLQLHDTDDPRTGRGQYFILVRCLFNPAFFYGVVDCIVVMLIKIRLSILMPIQIRIRIGIGTMLIGMRILPEHMFESREIFLLIFTAMLVFLFPSVP